jgi:hypothetical protein
VSGSSVFVGGDFSSIGSAARNRLAAINGSTGQVTSWNPGADNTVRSLAVSGSTVYAGGDFATLGDSTRTRIAAIDASTGIPTGWNPNADWTVAALTVSGSTIYAVGGFVNIGGATRDGIAALDASTGLATNWNPAANGYVRSIAVSGSVVYVGGSFSAVGDSTRHYLAALSASTGKATGWNPDIKQNVDVYTVAVSGSTVYAGGDFYIVGDSTRNRIAAIDATTGIATNWNPNADNWVWALAVSGSSVYVGGDFGNIGGASRNHIAAIDASTGLATSWDPNADGRVSALAISATNQRLYAGGLFSSILAGQRPFFAGMDNPYEPLPVTTATFTAKANPNGAGVLLQWSMVTEINNYGFTVERRGANEHSFSTISGLIRGAGTMSGPRQYSFMDMNVADGVYYYRLKQIDRTGAFEYSHETQVSVGIAPRVFSLSQNYPNPFNPTTTIEFIIPEDGRVVLKVYDIVGREVATLLDEDRKAGEYQQVVFDASRFASGVYLYRLQSGGFIAAKKLVLLK